jgi:hypothetical protein
VEVAEAERAKKAVAEVTASGAREEALKTEEEKRAKKLAASNAKTAAEKKMASEERADVRNMMVPDKTFVSKDVGPSITAATRRVYLTGRDYLSGLGGESPVKKAPARGKPKVATKTMGGYLDNMSSATPSSSLSGPIPTLVAPAITSAAASPSTVDSRARESGVTAEQEKKLAAENAKNVAENELASEKNAKEASSRKMLVPDNTFVSKDVGPSASPATKRGYLVGRDYLSGLGGGSPVKKTPARGKPKVATKAMGGYLDSMSGASRASTSSAPVPSTVTPSMTAAAQRAQENAETAEPERKAKILAERKAALERKDEELADPTAKVVAEKKTAADEAEAAAASRARENKVKAEQEEKAKIATESKEATSTGNESPVESIIGVVAPLKYMGPYPCLTLRFPNLSTSEQKARNLTGVSLDFVLDTGANVNSIDARLADQLALQLCASSKDLNILGSAGVGGTFLAGDIFLLGDCQLDGLPPGNNFTFMTNLTAAALPHASPVGHGLLSLSFFLSFPAGVEFDWYGTDGDPPTVIFYYGKELPENVKAGLIRVPLERLAAQVLSVTINVNGTNMPALLDTGSPITVMNHEAAKQAGIETVREPLVQPIPQRPQAYGDDSLTIRGVDSGLVNLSRSVSPVPIRAGTVSLGEGPVYVGDLPGLALVGGLSNSSVPGVVLGLDSLRRSYRMILRVAENELWFEELPKR